MGQYQSSEPRASVGRYYQRWKYQPACHDGTTGHLPLNQNFQTFNFLTDIHFPLLMQVLISSHLAGSVRSCPTSGDSNVVLCPGNFHQQHRLHHHQRLARREGLHLQRPSRSYRVREATCQKSCEKMKSYFVDIGYRVIDTHLA